jgi:NAD-dependent deacetylase
MSLDTLIQQTADLLRASKALVIVTGAGVSKESGIPTFRDALDGLWAQYDPQELATPAAFKKNPKLVWNFYEFRRELMKPAQPNPGHYALAQLEQFFPGLPVITQNIDDLHERAGSTHVVHLHGKIADNKCFFNCQGDPTPVDVAALEWDRQNGPPACPHCGRWVRPAVVWFGELLPVDALGTAKEAAARADVMLIVGTSGVVYPAAELPLIAARHQAKLVEVNPFESEISRGVDIWLQAPSGEVLPRVLAALAEV